ncbi:GntR family transcriptional regulator [Rhizobium cauense]|uniref:GntR family transcriptional regulator n=1 Tax=Rhizobium cauense TaxID=1166683 RepID=UPI001C6F263C|nr:GntR family transcriptional regulator [Rhizobium cauense]MBW9113365.1 GntR family transcriptional regulator [Rhizobium cauense]
MSIHNDDTIAGRISRALAERIVTGSLAPGSKLKQDHIAEEFGSSHVPVREALRRLEAQGLAVSEPRRGVRVATFDLKEVQEVAKMRAALEGLALRHSAEHLTPSRLDEAEQATIDGDNARDVRTWEEANRRFHKLILEPCNMPRLLSAIDDLHAASARFLFATWLTEWEPRIDQDHRTILAFLRAGKVENAVTALERHVQWIGGPSRRVQRTTRERFAIVG